MKAFTRACLALIVVSILFGCSPAKDADVKTATSAAEGWLAMVDSGRYGESWDAASAVFQEKISKSQWESTQGGGRSAYGDVVSRQLKSASYETNVAGGPAGNYVVIQYRTKFANSRSLTENLTEIQQPSGEWRVAAYFVRPVG
jgi:hypothetical protein